MDALNYFVEDGSIPSTSKEVTGVEFSTDDYTTAKMNWLESIDSGISHSQENEVEHDAGNRLTLAYEKLYDVPKTVIEQFADSVTVLDVSHNKLRNLDFVGNFKNITSIIADDNLITEKCFLPSLPGLRLLWLNHCRISSLFPWMCKLQESCPNLEHLCLMGNPAAPSFLNDGTFYEYLQYRLYVISLLRHLVHLDDRRVSEDEIQQAKQLYKKPLLTRILTFSKPNVKPWLETTARPWQNVQGAVVSLLEQMPKRKTAQSTRNLVI